MAISELPLELRPPTSPDLKIAVELRVKGSSEAMTEAFQSLGLKKINYGMVQSIRAAGISLAELGSVNIASGHSLITAQALTSTIIALTSRIQDAAESGTPEDKAAADKLLYPLGYLADKQSRVLTVMDKIQSPDKGQASAAKKARRSFMPGANVQTVQVINYNSPGESPPALPLK